MFLLFVFSLNNSTKLIGGFLILGVAILTGLDTAPMVIRIYRASLAGKTVKSYGRFFKRRTEIEK